MLTFRRALEINSTSSKNGQWNGKIKELEFEIDSYRTRTEQAESSALVKHLVWMLWNKEESSKKCILPTAFAPHLTASRFTNARPPTWTLHRLYATVLAQTLSKPKGRWEVITLLPSKNSTTFLPYWHVSFKFGQNLHNIHPSSQIHNYFIDPITHIWGDPISMTLFFFLLITKMEELFTTQFYI